MASFGRNTQAVRSELLRLGWSADAANALTGGFIQESGGGGDLNPNAIHDGNTGYGIAGYRDPKPGEGRRTNLFGFAKANGFDPADPITQARFAHHELGGEGFKGPGAGSEARAGRMLRNATSLEAASLGAIAFERPQGFSWDNPAAGHGYNNRIANARALAGLTLNSAPGEPRPYTGGNPSAPTISAAEAQNMAARRSAQMSANGEQPGIRLNGVMGAGEYAAATGQPVNTADAQLKMNPGELLTLEGLKKFAGNKGAMDGLTGVLKTATGAGQQQSDGSEYQISPAAGVQDDLGGRFAAAQQLMATLRPRGALAR